MKKEDISFVKQILNSIDENLENMKWSYKEKDSLNFNKYKKELIQLSEELENKINGK